MKKLFYLIILPLLCISCGDDEKPILTQISLGQENISFESEGGEAKINLEANREWQVSKMPSWISLDQTSGKTSAEITITALKNVRNEPRDTIISFMSYDKETILKIHQVKKELSFWYLFPSLSPFRVSSAPGKNKDEKIFNFSIREFFINPEANTNMKDEIFLGNIINRDLGTNTDIQVYKGYTLKPITLSASYIIKPKEIIPSKSEQDAYANLILSKMPRQSESFSSNGGGVEYNSHRELNLIGMGNMGVKLDEKISGKSYQEKEMEKKNGLIYSFSQTLFTIYMDFENGTAKEKINKEDFPNESLSYISGVSYGRIGLLIIESNNNIEKVKTAVNKILRNYTNEITKEDEAILEEIDAYHLYYNKSQKLVTEKGKTDILNAYITQTKDGIYNVFPYRISVLDYFTSGTCNINYSITMP